MNVPNIWTVIRVAVEQATREHSDVLDVTMLPAGVQTLADRSAELVANALCTSLAGAIDEMYGDRVAGLVSLLRSLAAQTTGPRRTR